MLSITAAVATATETTAAAVAASKTTTDTCNQLINDLINGSRFVTVPRPTHMTTMMVDEDSCDVRFDL